jgi:hypothetical protein
MAAGGDQGERLEDLEDLEDGVMRSKDVGRVKSLERDLAEREEALRKSLDLREFGTRMLKKEKDDLKSKEKQLGEINVKLKAMSVDQVEQRQTQQHKAALGTANNRNWRRPGDPSGAGTPTAPQRSARDNQQSCGNPDNAWHRELTDAFKQAQIQQGCQMADTFREIVREIQDGSGSRGHVGRGPQELDEGYGKWRTHDAYDEAMPGKWKVKPIKTGQIKEAHKVKAGNTTLFDGTKEMYSFWRTRQIAATHGQKMSIANKALALVETLDLKSSQTLRDLVLPLQYDVATYMNLINQLERHFGGKDSDLAMSAKALVHLAKIDMKSKASVTELATNLQVHKSLLVSYGRVET